MLMKARQEKQLKSSSNPSLRPVKNLNPGKSGSINAELAKHSISVSRDKDWLESWLLEHVQQDD